MKMPTLATMNEIALRFYNKHFGVRDLVDSQDALSSWFDSSLGQNILASEKEILDALVPEIYGYHLMELSVVNNAKLCQQCPVTHHFSLSPCVTSDAQARAAFEKLPVQKESLDAALLHHALEYSTNPHQLLAETARTIIPNGYIVIIGFNPWGMMQWRKWFGRYLLRKPHSRYHRLFRYRIMDWLQLLDFDVVYKKNAGFDLPFNYNTPQWIKTLLRAVAPFSGGSYIVVARKTRVPVTMIKTPWKKTSRFAQWVKRPAISRNSAQSVSISDEHNE